MLTFRIEWQEQRVGLHRVVGGSTVSGYGLLCFDWQKKLSWLKLLTNNLG